MKNKINVREASLRDQKVLDATIHNFRLRELDNVDPSMSWMNYSNINLEEFRLRLHQEKERHQVAYKKKHKRRLREDRINSFKEILITFPNEFGKKIYSNEITQEQLLGCFKIFQDELEKTTGTKVILSQIHMDEPNGTPHFHIIATNFQDDGSIFKKKGYYSYLQDLGGFAFSSLGLERGVSKNITNAKHITPREHYSKVLKQGNSLEEHLKNQTIDISNIDQIIEMAVPPFKTILIYLKRSMNQERESAYIIKQNERALRSFQKNFPRIKVDNTEEMIQEIIKNKNNYITPKR